MIYENEITRLISESINIADVTELRVFIKILLKKFKSYFDAYLQHVAYASQCQYDVEYILNAIWSFKDEMTLNLWEKQFKIPCIPDLAWHSVDSSILSSLTTAHLNCIARFRGLSNDYPRSMLLDFLTESKTKNYEVMESLEQMTDGSYFDILKFPNMCDNSSVEQLMYYTDRL